MPKRRGNGEGSIRKRKDGRWEGRYTVGYNAETGAPISRNVLGKTQTDVVEKLKAAIKQAETVDVQRSEQYTVAEWITLWFEVYSKPYIRETTAANYKNHIEQHIIPKLGKVKLNKLTSIQIQRFCNETKTSGRVKKNEKITDFSLSNRTVRGIYMLLHSCLNQAVRERLIQVNPTDNCKIPPKERKEMKVIPVEKIGDYLRAADERGVLPVFYLELSSGLRRGELLALLWTDLNIKNRTITVTKSVQRINGELKVKPPKTENSKRTIVIPQQAVDLLIQEHEKHPNNPYMFPSPVTGNMYDPDAMGRIHKKLLKAVGLDKGIRFHDLRHPHVKPRLKILLSHNGINFFHIELLVTNILKDSATA